jgi:ElaA protein
MITWLCKPFTELTAYELYAVMKLRNEVFVVEQNCVFQDADDKDQYCHHLLGTVNDNLAVYARLVPAGISYPEVSIGRVITSPHYRGTGLGKALMAHAINECYRLFGEQPIKIGAQLYLKTFYESFGFNQTSEMYLEDDIPHIEMLKD